MKSGKVEIKSVKAWLKRRSIRFYFITLPSLRWVSRALPQACGRLCRTAAVKLHMGNEERTNACLKTDEVSLC